MKKINPDCCPNLAEQISAYVDSELTIEIQKELKVHLVNCEDCNETYEIEIYIKQKLMNIKDVEQVPNELKQLIINNVIAKDPKNLYE